MNSRYCYRVYGHGSSRLSNGDRICNQSREVVKNGASAPLRRACYIRGQVAGRRTRYIKREVAGRRTKEKISCFLWDNPIY